MEQLLRSAQEARAWNKKEPRECTSCGQLLARNHDICPICGFDFEEVGIIKILDDAERQSDFERGN